MISYETFKEYVKEELILRLPPEFAHCRLAEDVIYKVNCRLDALRVMPQEAEKKALAVPVLYYRDFYPLIENGESPERVLSLIAEIIAKHTLPEEFVPSEEVPLPLIRKDDLVLELINYERNREYLKDKPHRRILDLALICRSVVNTADKQVYAAVIDREVMKLLALSEDELFRIAQRRMKERMPCKLFQVYQQLHAYTNEAFYLGAVSLLQKEGFRTLSARFQDDLYVLPASIHELMLLPKQMISLANVRALLRKANQEATKPEDWLSDQVYLYERSSDAVRLAEMEN